MELEEAERLFRIAISADGKGQNDQNVIGAAERICGITAELDQQVVEWIETIGKKIYPNKKDWYIYFSTLVTKLLQSPYTTSAELRQLELVIENIGN